MGEVPGTAHRPARVMATAPPGEGGGTLQGQLRALSERVLARARHDATVSSSAERSSAGPTTPLEASRAVGRLQRRALAILLRFDDDVAFANLDAEARAEQNALRLGAAALSMRLEGATADADLLEHLHDAFARRKAATSAEAASASGGDARPLEENASTIALLLSLANTGGGRGAGEAGARGVGKTSNGTERNRRRLADAPHENEPSADGTLRKLRHEARAKVLADVANRRAQRASAWLRLTPPAAFDAPPEFTKFGALDGETGFRDAESRRRVNAAAAFVAFGAPRLDVAPRLGGLGSVENGARRTADARIADGADASRRTVSKDAREGSFSFPSSETVSNDEGSLFGALRRARVPPSFDALEIHLAIGDTTPTPNPFAFPSRFEAAAARLPEAAPSGAARSGAARSANPVRQGSEPRVKRVPREPEAPLEANPWLSACAVSEEEASTDRPTVSVYGWDEPEEAPGGAFSGMSLTSRLPLDSFLAGGEAAFGDAYERSVRPTAHLFGAAAPARATQEEVVHATRRALAGDRAAARALVPRSERGDLLEHDAPRSKLDPPPLRLPAASAGSIAGALAPLAEAAEDRAALDAFVRRARESAGAPAGAAADLATQAAAGAVGWMLRAHDAALLGLPAAAARRRAEERASDEKTRGETKVKRVDAYRLDPGIAAREECGVTLLEARAHTRALRSRLAFLRVLCAPVRGDRSGSALLRRVFSSLQACAACDPGERDLLRRLASASAAPALAQARDWTRLARVTDPLGEFFIQTSRDWGAASNDLETSFAEKSVETWRVRAMRGEEDDDASWEDAPSAFDSDSDSNWGGDLSRLPPWLGGIPGRASDGDGFSEERASLREYSPVTRNVLFAGAERDALVAGVHLRMLQRMPQTRAFAMEVGAMDGREARR